MGWPLYWKFGKEQSAKASGAWDVPQKGTNRGLDGDTAIRESNLQYLFRSKTLVPGLERRFSG